MMIWCPLLMTLPYGKQYGMHLHFTWFSMPGLEQKMVTSRIEYDNGAEIAITDIQPRLAFDKDNRRLHPNR